MSNFVKNAPVMIVVGKSQNGKTSLCNALTDGSGVVGDGFVSQTRSWNFSGLFRGVQVIDTPGFNEVAGGRVSKSEVILSMTKLLLKIKSVGVTSICYVRGRDVISEEDENNVSMIKSLYPNVPVIVIVSRILDDPALTRQMKSDAKTTVNDYMTKNFGSDYKGCCLSGYMYKVEDFQVDHEIDENEADQKIKYDNLIKLQLSNQKPVLDNIWKLIEDLKENKTPWFDQAQSISGLISFLAAAGMITWADLAKPSTILQFFNEQSENASNREEVRKNLLELYGLDYLNHTLISMIRIIVGFINTYKGHVIDAYRAIMDFSNHLGQIML